MRAAAEYRFEFIRRGKVSSPIRAGQAFCSPEQSEGKPCPYDKEMNISPPIFIERMRGVTPYAHISIMLICKIIY